MKNILTVSKDKVRNEWDLPYGGTDDVEVILDEIIDNGRWSIHHHLIVRIEDKFYETSYSRAATECQDERPWEYDKVVEFVEVREVEKLVRVWEVVNK